MLKISHNRDIGRITVLAYIHIHSIHIKALINYQRKQGLEKSLHLTFKKLSSNY